MHRLIIIGMLSSLLTACNTNSPNHSSTLQAETKLHRTDLTAFVDPLIGTSKMGHVFPGATAPFGMTQVSPQTNFISMFDSVGNYVPETYEYCAGYQYRDTTIIGFAHTNFSGTGHSDLGDLLLMPTTGELILSPLPNAAGEEGFYSNFSHDRERVSAGYYEVFLDRYQMQARLTATERVAYHQYTFPEGEKAHLILDMLYNVYHHDDKNVWSFVRVENDTLVTGYRQTRGWGRTRTVYFAMAFSQPISSYGQRRYDNIQYDGFYRRFDQTENFPEMAGRDLRLWFDFDTAPSQALEVKVALSPVSTAGAVKNMQAEIPIWDFEKVKEATRVKWHDELARVEVDLATNEQMTTFYTALYHSFLTPIIYEDVDGSYRGLDQNIHHSDGFVNHSIFSLWDTYRALHPWFNLIQPSRNIDMAKSMLAHQEQSVHGMLPIWSHYANENWCMIGYHATSVLADAIVKNPGKIDVHRALEASVTTANVSYFDGLGEYIKYGYVPDDLSHSSVSKTLEYAYDDWCIAQIASVAGDTATAHEFMQRSASYLNVYDPSVGFMRPKLADGNFRADFDPMDTHGQGFIEGNAWNYGLYVPQDPERMIALMGGKTAFEDHLDSIFTMEIEDKYIEKHEDITRDGIIGTYVHGNEPGHHIPYLYNYTEHPEKTQARVRMIMDTMYGAGVNGLCGNDDAGQMSAWYLFSALGFYPLAPGSEFYEIGSPLISHAVMKLENGRQLEIVAEDQSPENVYVQKVLFNDVEITDQRLKHSDLMNGGKLVFIMSSNPHQ